MQGLSKKQQSILEYIVRCVKEQGYPPSVREIAEAVGLKSPSTVHTHLTKLENAGYIIRGSGKTRAITLAEGVADGVPILGTVAAGQPILATEDIMGFLPYKTDENGDYFALEISGDSMIDAGILDGDMVVVRQQDTAQSGEIVIAIFEDEATCKTLKIRDGHVWLMPENDAYEPIDGSYAQILGKVTAVIRTYY